MTQTGFVKAKGYHTTQTSIISMMNILNGFEFGGHLRLLMKPWMRAFSGIMDIFGRWFCQLICHMLRCLESWLSWLIIHMRVRSA